MEQCREVGDCVLVLIFPKAYSEMRIWVQVGFLGSDPRKQNGNGKVRGREESKQRDFVANYSDWELYSCCLRSF